MDENRGTIAFVQDERKEQETEEINRKEKARQDNDLYGTDLLLLLRLIQEHSIMCKFLFT